MAYSRYTNTTIFKNNDPNYRKTLFEKRGISQTFQYSTYSFEYPDNEDIASFQNISRVWGASEKLYNIAAEYYGSPEYWWVIAWYNKKPTEAHFNIGDTYYIPLPLSDVLAYF